jgi:hypothetical protein
MIGIITGLFGRLVATRFGRILASIPRKVWIALAAVAIVLGAQWLHSRAVNSAYTKAFAEGAEVSDQKWLRAFEVMQATAEEWRLNYERQSARISGELRDAQEKELRNIAGSADALRLRGAGAAAASCRPGDNPGVSGAAGGHAAGDGGADASMAGVSAGGLALVPWGPLIDHAEHCDANRNEVTVWRNWYNRQSTLLTVEKDILHDTR